MKGSWRAPPAGYAREARNQQRKQNVPGGQSWPAAGSGTKYTLLARVARHGSGIFCVLNFRCRISTLGALYSRKEAENGGKSWKQEKFSTFCVWTIVVFHKKAIRVPAGAFLDTWLQAACVVE
ncbi:hypothetical protein [Hymenobacter yonginensis]|uniref:Uncharacterized protein n=1 Tax=Hymenobacter yonginensis TaxID=748197 RepID=A0ABY7PLT8_9BACT|nr:hypothetical protein [Hymenobacter yonginensis]WBO83967.1 hypothetical protein O9Z63_16505 [Hymenobacter yonginensis]